MRPRFAPPRLALCVFCLIASPALKSASGQSGPAPFAPETLASETAVGYAEISELGPLLDVALAPKTRDLLQNVDGYQKYLQSDKYRELQAVVGLLEGRLGKSWDAALRELVGGGISVSFEPASQAVLLVVRSRDRELLGRLHTAIVELVEADAKAHGRPSPVKSQEYRGFTGWSFGGEENHIIVDDLLLVSNKVETLKAAVDRRCDPAANKSLAGSEDFAAARARRPGGTTGWAWLRVAALRQDPKVQQALAKRSDNPLVELLLAGVIDALKQSPYATASVVYDADSLRLRTELPRPNSAPSAARAWYFAARGDEAALVPPGTIGTFTMFRDLAGLWVARDELFDEATAAKFAQADTQLGLFFSGRDFGPEVLGELDAPLQVIVARQDYPADKPIPALKLPAFALALKLKHADDFAPELLVTYQKFIGIFNLTGGQEGRPQLLLSTEDYQGTTISKAAYLHNPKTPKENAPPHYNFSPACARIGDHFVFGSTVGIVRQVVDALKHSPATLKDNTALTVESAPLVAILADNKELLITQNMLGRGHSRSEAETAVQNILDVLGQLTEFVLRIDDEAGSLAIDTVLRLKGT